MSGCVSEYAKYVNEYTSEYISEYVSEYTNEYVSEYISASSSSACRIGTYQGGRCCGQRAPHLFCWGCC